MTSQEVAQKHSQDVNKSQSSVWHTTKETVSSATASLSGAFSFSGGLSAHVGAYNKKTATSSRGSQKLSKQEAEQQYEENIEDEYAKREGGA